MNNQRSEYNTCEESISNSIRKKDSKKRVKLKRPIYCTTSTPFGPTHSGIMDRFLSMPLIVYTPLTMFLTLVNYGDIKCSRDTVKNCMSLLLKNSYITKQGGPGTNSYSITKENMEFWATDFKRYVLDTADTKNYFQPVELLEKKHG